MTIAELHGKLSPRRPGGFYERMEDLLTSDVFSTMKYAGWQYGFMDWLRSARSPFEDKTNVGQYLPVDDDILKVDFEFWPTLHNGREPDVMLGIKEKDGSIVLVMIEAKYLSGPSNFEVSDELHVVGITGDQLADQINAFPSKWEKDGDTKVTKRIHIYLTAHFDCPIEAYQNAKFINNTDVEIFWMNWQRLTEFLRRHSESEDEGKGALIADLLCLLEKKDLIPFEGFKRSSIPEKIFQYGITGFWDERWWPQSSVPVIPQKNHFWSEQ